MLCAFDSDDFGLSDGEDSDFQGEDITGYLPGHRFELGFKYDGGPQKLQEDDQEDNALDQPAAWEERMEQPAGKSTTVERKYEVWDVNLKRKTYYDTMYLVDENEGSASPSPLGVLWPASPPGRHGDTDGGATSPTTT